MTAGTPPRDEPDFVPDELADPRRAVRRPRIGFHIPHPALRSPLGLLVVFMLVAGFGAAGAVGTVMAIQWTETPSFCGSCHTMDPELKAFVVSAHRELTCGECHVEPGPAGWVKAKIKGTKQLFQILTDTYPIPILPPAHEELPSVHDSCTKCHDVSDLVASGGPVKLVLENKYALDETNTQSKVALVLRPQGIGFAEKTRGVHWHISDEYDVRYLRADEHAQRIDYVRVAASDGSVEEYIAKRAVADPDDVGPSIATLRASETERKMDCLDCHNRVGHEAPTVAGAIDRAIDDGAISAGLPFIKREAMTRIAASYPDVATADASIEALREFYGTTYPLVANELSGKVDRAVDELKTIYHLIATPHMEVTSGTFPNNLGHQGAPGCFRCHDGAHYQVVDGKLTTKTIPSSCQTCHTFPQIGTVTSAVLIGDRPANHAARLWTFEHKNAVASADPEGTTCGACHTRTYCDNCHATKVVQVPHDGMLLNHAAIVRDLGAATCTVCHQVPYCSQCHAEDVLPSHAPDQVTPIGPTGLVEEPPVAELSVTRRW